METIRDDVLPHVDDLGDKWWQQDGAPCHTAKKVMDFLKSNFQERIISQKSGLDYFWPAHSPDLNPLDFSFWGQCESQIHDDLDDPDSHEVIAKVNEIAENFSEQSVRKMTQNIRKRARLCLQENGGLFEHLLKIKDFNIEPGFEPEE